MDLLFSMIQSALVKMDNKTILYFKNFLSNFKLVEKM